MKRFDYCLVILLALLLLLGILWFSVWYESLDDGVCRQNEVAAEKQSEQGKTPCGGQVASAARGRAVEAPCATETESGGQESGISTQAEVKDGRSIRRAKPAAGARDVETPSYADQQEAPAETDPARAGNARQSTAAASVVITDEDVRMLAVLLEHESIDLADELEWSLPLWCVLNRLDDQTGRFPCSINAILTQPGQFLKSYSKTPRASTVEYVKHQLMDYIAWKIGETDARPLPEGLVFYSSGPGYRYNIFRTEYAGGRRWARGNWID